MTGPPGTTPRKRVAWVVDVQNDFMRPPEAGGRLYVHDLFDSSDRGATLALAPIRRFVDWATRACDVVVFTGDFHSAEDPEIDAVAPDASRGTYPPHCMGLSSDPSEREGAEIIAEVRPPNPIPLDRDADEPAAAEVVRAALVTGRPIMLRKKEFSCFTGNAATGALVRELVSQLGGDVEFVVAGVARDVCVTAAIDGMLERGLRVVAVPEAMWGLGLEPADVTLARWTDHGARVAGLDELTAVIPQERRAI